MPTAKFGPLSWEQPHTPSVNHCLYIFGPSVTGSRVVGLGPYAWPSVSWGLNQEPSDSYYNALTYQVTLPVFLSNIKIKTLHQNQNFKLTQSEKTTEVS